MIDYAFVHIPKNAGMSMSKALDGHDKIKYFGHGVHKYQMEGLKKIYILREPVDRFTSAFFYMKDSTHGNAPIHNFQNPEELIQSILLFDVNSYRALGNSDHKHHIYGSPINTNWVFAKQSDWFFSPHKVLIYDNLKNDIQDLSNEINSTINLPKLNVSNRSNFKQSDYSLESVDFLKLVYRKDFDLYNHYR